ncbi:GNAT family N-acetyltransferase [Streptomyces halobius]|uniref:GNAT family N-acetyltransferase n=1 Tax=Streptomyces halobius TaxID=2879846 RepID=A0ABY4M804_9ACTN|nr:GNAT family N-acetyltransferase [Streptomyces halobius]UQA92396.1 GNAT family N-acetyltransferase [Streptomyces halobius]
MIIRTPSLAELPLLRDIERAAGEPFRPLGMARIADDEPPSVAELTRHQRVARVLAAYDSCDFCDACGRDDTHGRSDAHGRDDAPASSVDGPPVGYLLWEPVDGCTHIEQVSVRPDHAHRGIGRALIDRAMLDSRAAALTLTTFAEVPWNAPYYTRIGFRVLPDSELNPGLRAIRAREAELGLDRWPRVSMRRSAVGDPAGA